MTVDDALQDAAVVCRVSAQSLKNLNHPDLAQNRMLTAAVLVDHRLNRMRDSVAFTREVSRLSKEIERYKNVVSCMTVFMVVIVLAALVVVGLVAR